MKFKIVIFVLLLDILLSVPAHASVPVSPALDVISASRKMIRSTLNEELGFSVTDFEDHFGCKINSLTVTELPEGNCGKLMLGSLPVSKRQTITRGYIDMLCFSPAGSEFSESGFRFTVSTENGNYQTTCSLLSLDPDNTAPTSAGLDPSLFEISVKSDIDYFGTLYAIDGEGALLDFEITEYPENATLTLLDSSSGGYKYSPKSGYKGSDSFSYTARDKYGSVSDEITVSVDVDADNSVFYSDLGGHWAHTAAIEMTERGVMSGCVKSGMRFFEPEEPILFASFVTAAMKSVGYELDDVRGAQTVFWDDCDIGENDAAYISEAYKCGFIQGSEDPSGRLMCYPNREITRGEAAVILSRMIDTEPVLRAVFADETAVPTEAQEAIYTLNSLGIMVGTGDSNIAAQSILTRAQAAVMLTKVLGITEE